MCALISHLLHTLQSFQRLQCNLEQEALVAQEDVLASAAVIA